MSRFLPVLAPAPRPMAAPVNERVAPRAVRISITDRCDLACVYCRPNRKDGYLPAAQRLTAERWETLVRGLAQRGIRRVRITGGEPLVHPHVVDIVRAIARVPGIDDVALTTNGTRLTALAPALRDAGLRRVNVSIDSLDPSRFFRLTRGGRLSDVLDGVDAARRAGFRDLKTNTVALAGENEHELETIVRWAWSLDATPRLLELMSVGHGARLSSCTMPYPAMRARLAALLGDDDPAPEPDRGPARYVRARDGVHRVGFITGASESFCAGCDRLRVSSDGRLRPCLATNDAVDVTRELRLGDLAGIGARLDEAWAEKPDGELWRGCREDAARDVDMRSTGG
ncbi:MAG: GTP 3',8-cyclase MoaA [Deltaproteobacteria bacterium]|nr:GTP 3',8-cyclase MoaA [Deltaproteobacteria bacterium]